MKRYEVKMWVESDGEPEDDPEVTKAVDAPDTLSASNTL